jgi:hypothetical protein
MSLKINKTKSSSFEIDEIEYNQFKEDINIAVVKGEFK